MGVGAARGGSFSGHLSILSCWARHADSQAPLGVSVEPRHLTRMGGTSQALQLWSAGSVHPSAPGPLPAGGVGPDQAGSWYCRLVEDTGPLFFLVGRTVKGADTQAGNKSDGSP